MSDTTLKMLDMASSHSARIFAQIDNAITRNMNLQLQAKEQEAAFAWKAAQFGEQMRITDHEIQQDKINNFYKAQEFQVRQQILPLEIQAKNLDLQYNKIRYQEALKKQEDTMFKELSGFADERIAAEFLRTGDLNALDDYSKLRASVQQDIMNGVREFDVETYDQETKKIQFASQEVTKYDPAVSRRLQQLSPDAYKSYEHKHNPVYKTQAAGHAASFVIGGKPEDFRAFAELADEDAAAKVMANRTKVDFNQRWLDTLLKDHSKASTALAAARTDKEREVAEKLILSLEQKINERYNIIDSIVNGVSTGVYDIPGLDKQEQKQPDNKKPEEDPERYSSVIRPPVMGVPDVQGGDNLMRDNMADLVTAVNPSYKSETQTSVDALEGTIFENVDAKWYYENRRELDSASLGKTRERIFQSISEHGKPKREEVERMKGLITSPVEVPLSRAATRILVDTFEGSLHSKKPPTAYAAINKARATPAAEMAESAINFLRTGSTGKVENLASVVIDGSSERSMTWAAEAMPKLFTNGIKDEQDIRDLVKKIPDKDERELVERELYAAYAAAAFKSQVEK